MFKELFAEKPIIGMIHMPALPGAPNNNMSMKELIEYSLSELKKLERAGLTAVIVENVGDIPLSKSNLEAPTIAAMANIVREVVVHTKLRVGVNMLRNACVEALSVAHVSGAHFIRCNVMIGAYVTDQGIIEGCATQLLRLKRNLNSNVLIFGDVHVKHSYPLFNVPIEYAAQDLAERGGADAIIVSGPRSPIPPSLETVGAVKQSVNVPVLVGSGITLSNIKKFYDIADGIILGETDFKIDHIWGGPSDENAYSEAVRICKG